MNFIHVESQHMKLQIFFSVLFIQPTAEHEGQLRVGHTQFKRYT